MTESSLVLALKINSTCFRVCVIGKDLKLFKMKINAIVFPSFFLNQVGLQVFGRLRDDCATSRVEELVSGKRVLKRQNVSREFTC